MFYEIIETYFITENKKIEIDMSENENIKIINEIVRKHSERKTLPITVTIPEMIIPNNLYIQNFENDNFVSKKYTMKFVVQGDSNCEKLSFDFYIQNILNFQKYSDDEMKMIGTSITIPRNNFKIDKIN